jgi:hypothetical protein
MNRLTLATALLPVVAACAPLDNTGDDDDGENDSACEVGRFVATTIAFEESGCLDQVVHDGATFSVSAPGLSWQVFAFDDGVAAGTVLDDTNSSTTGRYEREGLEWVAFTGAIGGTPQGESTLTLDAVTDGAWRGRIDGVAVPGGNNDSLDSVFVTVVIE